MKKIFLTMLLLIFILSPAAAYTQASSDKPDQAGEGNAASLDQSGEAGSASDSESEVVPEYTEFSQLSGKTISLLTGAPLEEIVKSKVPDVGDFTYFNTMPDAILALKSGKTDAVLSNNAVSLLSVNRNSGLTIFPQSLKDGFFGIAFAKGNPARDQWQAAYDTIPEETKKAVWEKWTGSDESLKVMPKQDWPGRNGTVTVASCDSLEPLSYTGEGEQIIGFDNEMILLIAKEMDVHVNFVGMEFSAVMAYVQSGKSLMGVGSLIVTEERKEACDFVEYYPAAFTLVVRAVEDQEKNSSFWSKIVDSFEKTFIRENRWKLFVEGICTTLFITFVSMILGTVLGFLIFLLCRRGNRFANSITRFFLWLVQGMPMVVFLMILFYIIFGNISINGAFVAVIGFTITFGASVFGLLKMGVGAVDDGQYEAAYALGYGKTRTFFEIIFPQALPHILPAYRGEVVSLIKATAIVGYIAVQDLTKMGDIIRSRTYEAFFPLIAVTIIYFVLEEVVSYLVGRITINLEPEKRSPEDILKGIELDETTKNLLTREKTENNSTEGGMDQ